MKAVSIQDLKARLSAIVAQAEAGATIVITRHNAPVARLSPARTDSVHLPAVQTLRSLELTHLRSALWFHAGDPIERFVTLDDTQEQAARELGLPV